MKKVPTGREKISQIEKFIRRMEIRAQQETPTASCRARMRKERDEKGEESQPNEDGRSETRRNQKKK